MSFSSTAPALMTRQYGSVISTVVAPPPGAQAAVEHQIDAPVHHAENVDAAAAGRLARNVGAGRDQRLLRAVDQRIGEFDRDCRSASRPVFPVTLSGHLRPTPGR